MLRALTRRLKSRGFARAAVAGILAGAALLMSVTPVLGHVTNFVIWYYGGDVDSGTDNHYHKNPGCPANCAWDYMMPTYTTVYQSYPGQGDFAFYALHMPAGVTFGPGVAYRGHNTWVFGNGGSTVLWNGDYFCTDINYGLDIFIGYRWSGSSTGYWYQDSGFGGGNCYTSYSLTDDMTIQAGQ